MAGDNSGSDLQCPFCGASNEHDASYCIHCGSSMEHGNARGADAAVLAPGTVIREFRIVKLLGEGGMGLVYEAVHVFTGAKVAVKRMLPGLSQDPQLRQRFIWEARVMAICKHSGLVDIKQLFVEGGRFFLVMQFLAGQTAEDIVLSQRNQGHQLDLREAVDIVAQVALALQHMHDLDEEIEVPDEQGVMELRRIQGVVHRDVKPGNIMVDASGRACLMDFGIAKAQGGETMTRIGGVVGTYEYMSPQQIQGETVTFASDQYSLAVSLYMMLTGEVPFPQKTSGGFDAQEGHVRKPPPPPRSARSDIPEALNNVILKALAKEPDQRFPSCRAFAEALRDALQGKSVPVPPTRSHSPGKRQAIQEDWGNAETMRDYGEIPPSPGPPAWLFAGLGVLVVGVLVVGGVLWLRGNKTEEAPGPSKAAVAWESTRKGNEALQPRKEEAKKREETKVRKVEAKKEEAGRDEELNRELAEHTRLAEKRKMLAEKQEEERRRDQELKKKIKEQARLAAERERLRKEREEQEHRLVEEAARLQAEKERLAREQAALQQAPPGMIKVPEGCFTMGTTGQSNAPETTVCLSVFAIDENLKSGAGAVTWDVADQACRERGFELASEAQWERAAAGDYFGRAAGKGYRLEAEWVRDFYAKSAYVNSLEGRKDATVTSTSEADFRPGVTAKYQQQGKTSSNYCRVSRANPYGSCTDWKRCRSFWMPDYARKYGWRCVKVF